MSKFITFNGVTYVHPGAVSKVDVTALAQISPSATGIVALVGEAEGGQPNMVTDINDPNFDVPKIYTFFDPANASATFRSGPLADAINLAFDAGNDPRIPGGASRVLAIKTNQSTGSSAILNLLNDPANEAASVRSKDYGVHTANIEIELDVSAADINNNELTVTVRDNSTGITETLNNVAGKGLLDSQYLGPDFPVPLATGTVTGWTFGTLTVADSTKAFDTTPNAIDAPAPGNWMVITKAPSGNTATGLPKQALVGQCRRIATIATATTFTLEEIFFDNAGNGLGIGSDLIDCEYMLFKEVQGPFLAIDDVGAGATTYDPTGPTLRFRGAPDEWPGSDGAAVVSTIYSVTNSDGSFSSNNIYNFDVSAADAARYAAATGGPNYIKIVTGPGAGQVRRIESEDHGTAQQLEVTLESAFDTAPTVDSQFMFINLSKGTAIQNGAEMRRNRSHWCGDTAHVGIAPWYGEFNPVGSVPVTVAGTLFTDFTIALTALTASDVINGINAPPTPAISFSKRGWTARISSGRTASLLASRLDWDITGSATNTTVFACVGFDEIFQNSYGLSAVGAAVPVKKYRLMDNLEQLIATVNAQSGIVSMAKEVGANEGSSVPQLNLPATPLTGGASGTTATTDLLNAYDVLIRHRHNTVVPLWSADGPSISLDEVHSATLSHTNLGSGAAKNENDAILAATVTGANALIDIQNFQADLNNRNCALVYQGVERTNVDGEMTDFPAHMFAVLCAGMQAGAPVGTPLTYKYMRTNDLEYPGTLDPKDTTVNSQLLLSGILFAEPVRGKGFRIVRNLSTYTQTDNVAYTDRNVNEVLNYISYDIRTFIEERFTGVKATPATATSIKESLIAKLSSYRDQDIIVDSTDLVTGQRINAFRHVRVTISGDIATIRFELFPVIGINYETIEIFAQLPVISG